MSDEDEEMVRKREKSRQYTAAYRAREKAKRAADPEYAAARHAAEREKANTHRRERYATDPEFRQRLLDDAKQRQMAERRAAGIGPRLVYASEEDRRAARSAKHRDRWANDPDYRNRMRASSRAWQASPEGKAKIREAAKRRGPRVVNPEARERIRQGRQVRYANDPEFRERLLASNRKSNRQPEAREASRQAWRRWRDRLKARCAADPDLAARVLEKLRKQRTSPASRKAQQRWRAQNREHMRSYYRSRRQSNPQYRIGQNLRSRLYGALKRAQAGKAASAVLDCGCSLDRLVAHIERQFSPEMTWDNYGIGAGQWSIDHSVPLTAFDLTDPEQQRQAVHWTNLRPLWHAENLRKGGCRR